MARINKKQPVISSILDKLIDDAPEKLHEPVKTRHQLLNELYQSVRRDLENLLNSRIAGMSWPAEWHQLNQSLFAYGITDFMNTSLSTVPEQNKFCEELAKIIQRFEPRFQSVQVQLLQDINEQDRTLRMRIEGLLHVEPAPELIIFDSVLEPQTNHFLITETSLS